MSLVRNDCQVACDNFSAPHLRPQMILCSLTSHHATSLNISGSQGSYSSFMIPFMLYATTQTLANVASTESSSSTSSNHWYWNILQYILTKSKNSSSHDKVHRSLCHLHLSNKDVLGCALDWNIEQEAIFMNQIANLVENPNIWCLVTRLQKWVHFCMRAGLVIVGDYMCPWKCFVHEQWYLILPILTLDGIITYNIIKGLVTSDQFLQFFWIQIF